MSHLFTADELAELEHESEQIAASSDSYAEEQDLLDDEERFDDDTFDEAEQVFADELFNLGF